MVVTTIEKVKQQLLLKAPDSLYLALPKALYIQLKPLIKTHYPSADGLYYILWDKKRICIYILTMLKSSKKELHLFGEMLLRKLKISNE